MTVTYTIKTDQDNEEISGEHTVKNARNAQMALDSTENWLYSQYPHCEIVSLQVA